MFTRYIMIFSALLVVSACSGGKDKGGVEMGGVENGGVMIDGQNADGVYGENLDGPAPGSQADLVINVGDRIFFETDSTDLTSSARSTLENQASWLNQYPSLGITVEGHADERGTREYNLALGERRANSVRNYLVALGVSSTRISTITFGKERPAVPGSDTTSWSQNRRGVTKVQ